MDPQRPNVPTAEPTPDSPAPTQTSPVTPEPKPQPSISTPPVTPGPAAAAAVPAVPEGPLPTPGQPAQPVPPAGTQPLGSKSPGFGSPRKLVAAVAAVVVIVLALIFLFLSPWSPFVSAAPTGPALLVGKNKYVNACSVFDKALVTKELDIKSDVNKENVAESFAYDPSNDKDKEINLLDKTESTSVFSTCMLKLDRVQEGSGDERKNSFVNISAAVEQFADDQKASEAFKEDKQKINGVKTLPGFSDTSYYATPRALYAGTPAALQPRVLHKNMIIVVSIPVDEEDKTNGEGDVPHAEALIKDVIARIDKNEGGKPKNFSGINEIGGNKFTDACLTVNYAKVVAAMGNGTQFDIRSVTGNQAFAPDNNGGQTPDQLTSACTFYFRTQYEIDQAAGYQPPEGTDSKLAYGDRFPHYISVQIASTADKEKAKAYLDSARKEGEETAKNKQSEDDKTTVEDVALGDGAIRMDMQKKYAASSDMPASESRGQLYYITKGPHIYILAVTYSKQEKPIKSELKDLSLDQVKKIYKEMTMATKRAN